MYIKKIHLFSTFSTFEKVEPNFVGKVKIIIRGLAPPFQRWIKVDLVNIHVCEHMSSAAHLIQFQLIQNFALGRLFTKFRRQINDLFGMQALA